MTERLTPSELFQYLVALSQLLKAIGEVALAELVIFASKLSSGSTSELFGEARLLLPRVLREAGGIMSGPDRERLAEVSEQIENEFRLIGGA